MQRFVALLVVGPSELPVAYVARVRLLGGMGFHVRLEVVWFLKYLTALGAREGLVEFNRRGFGLSSSFKRRRYSAAYQG